MLTTIVIFLYINQSLKQNRTLKESSVDYSFELLMIHHMFVMDFGMFGVQSFSSRVIVNN